MQKNSPSPFSRSDFEAPSLVSAFGNPLVLVAVFAALLVLPERTCFSVDAVSAEVKQSSVWAGQPANLFITLRSPGPFSGTASFSLPELPLTAFLKIGSPVVGSETIEGDTWLTQRHEFLVFSQQVGDLELPPFDVRFKGKKDFVSDAVPVEGKTPALQFTVRRPPGTATLGVVVAATKQTTRQEWNPKPTRDESGSDPAETVRLQEGGVLRRQITRVADGTTAMMIPPIRAKPPEGVKVYPVDPTVDDQTDRGDLVATRIDTVKYQFQRSGAYQLADIEVVWWDVGTEELRRESVSGLRVVVEAHRSAEASSADGSDVDSEWQLLRSLILLCIGLILLWLAIKGLKHWNAIRMHPEKVALRQLREACRRNDLKAAYRAFEDWRRCSGIVGFSEDPRWEPLGHACQEMASLLFAPNPPQTDWSGQHFWQVFQATTNQGADARESSMNQQGLPPLNPTSASG